MYLTGGKLKCLYKMNDIGFYLRNINIYFKPENPEMLQSFQITMETYS